MKEPSSLVCVCGHTKNEHSAIAPLCRVVKCNCYNFNSTLEAAKVSVEDARNLKQIHKDAEDYAALVAKHRCPKCGKGTAPQVEHHSKKSWYQWNSCKLGLKKEHLHFTCNVCKAHYFEETVEDLLYGKY